MRAAFAPLRTRNYRLYFAGQSISLVGTWFVLVATGWLALSLSHSGAVLGALMAAELLPSLLLGTYAGVIADRVCKRALILADNALAATLSALLALACLTGTVTLAMVFCFGVALGVSAAFAQPAQQAFISEMVSDAQLKETLTLNAMIGALARTAGPACAGLILAGLGVGACFALNALSYIAILAALARMRPDALKVPEPPAREPRALRAGLRYARSRPQLLWPLVMAALVGTFAYEFAVTLPLIAKALGGDAATYGLMTAAMGAGALIGGLAVNHRLSLGLGTLRWCALAFAAALSLAALAPSVPLELAALVLVGGASTAFMATLTASLQLAAEPRLRGRVMALSWVANAGSTPLGAPAVGALAALKGARAGLLAGALACALSAIIGFAAHRRTGTEDGAR